MGRKEPYEDDQYTHGICPPCGERLAQLIVEPAVESKLPPRRWEALLNEVKTVAHTSEERVGQALAQE
jgi:hypothetical protein